MFKSMIKVLTLLSCAFFLSASLAAAGQIDVWGSTTCQKSFLEPGNDAFKAASGDTIKVYGVGTGKGMMALLEGKTKVAAASSPLASAIKSAQKAAKEAGKDVAIPDNLVFHELAKDVIVPIVHESNPVSALSFDQLSKLNSGEVTNWKDVGGPDLAVKVVTSHAGSATRAVFQEKVMKKAEYVTDATLVNSTRLEIQQVAKNAGGIGAVSEDFYKQNPAGVKLIKTDEISRPLALITIGEPTPEVQKLIDFFRSPAGQKFFE
jgi:phosphate transport system substrate-binding protein